MSQEKEPEINTPTEVRRVSRFYHAEKSKRNTGRL